MSFGDDVSTPLRRYWVDVLSRRPGDDAVEFTNITTLTVCGLVEGVASTNAFVGTINYANADVADKAYTLPMALTISAQRSLLPVTAAVLTANPCLRTLPWIVDLTVMVEMRSRADAQQCVQSPFHTCSDEHCRNQDVIMFPL